MPLVFFSIPLSLFLSLISERNKAAVQMDVLWQISVLFLFQSEYKGGRDGRGRWMTTQLLLLAITGSQYYTSPPVGVQRPLNVSWQTPMQWNSLLFICVSWRLGSVPGTLPKEPHCAGLYAPSLVYARVCFPSFRVGRELRSHPVSGQLRQTQRVALGDKVMSEGLRVGVAFGLTHGQSSAQWPLGHGDNS